MIKKYVDFVDSKSGSDFDYGCIMIYLKIDNWIEITSIISPEDVYEPENPSYGIDSKPHITLLFGLHPEVTPEDVESVLSKFRGKKIDININGISKFDNEDFSVVKLNVDSPILHDINAELSKLPHTSDFPEYNPHVTLSYVQPGKADKYISDNYKVNLQNIDRIVYSMTDGKKIEFKL